MTRPVPVVAVALLAALTSCAGAPRPLGAPPGVSYRLVSETLAERTARAERYCGQYSKRARLKDIESRAGDDIARYECV